MKNTNLKTQSYAAELKPTLIGQINFYQEIISLSSNGQEFSFQVNKTSQKQLEKLFSMMDGSNSIEKLQQIFFPNQPQLLNSILHNLDRNDFLKGVTPIKLNSGVSVVRELQNLRQQLVREKFNLNSLWQSLELENNDLLRNFSYGFAIAHYNLFSQTSSVLTSSLNSVTSTKVKTLISRLYFQSCELEELLLKSLKSIDINPEKLLTIMPLPETRGLGNALSYWANFEPLFYFLSLELLSNDISDNFQAYLQICEKINLKASFIEPIAEIVNIQLNNKLDDLTEQVFLEIPHIDRESKKRFRGQTYLLLEMDRNFYRAIWNHYATSTVLEREIAVI